MNDFNFGLTNFFVMFCFQFSRNYFLKIFFFVFLIKMFLRLNFVLLLSFLNRLVFLLKNNIIFIENFYLLKEENIRKMERNQNYE